MGEPFDVAVVAASWPASVEIMQRFGFLRKSTNKPPHARLPLVVQVMHS